LRLSISICETILQNKIEKKWTLFNFLEKIANKATFSSTDFREFVLAKKKIIKHKKKRKEKKNEH
jgi:hypothetical protein